MHKNATKYNETLSKWCKNKHEASKIIDTFETYQTAKRKKEKIHISTGEWRIIMSAINHGTEVPADSRTEVLMGYQYALH
jgi:hypothetical protein